MDLIPIAGMPGLHIIDGIEFIDRWSFAPSGKERFMKEAKKRVIYSNYDGMDFDEAKRLVFESLAEVYGWKSEEDVPDDEVYDCIKDEDACWWDDESRRMNDFFSSGRFLLKGTIGRWDGPAEGGFIFSTFKEMHKAWDWCDYIEFYDANGHFRIRCSHHDGTNYYEVRELTPAGIEYESNHGSSMPTRQLHEKLWNSSKYTKLPHYANKVLGCKRIEYEPEQKSA